MSEDRRYRHWKRRSKQFYKNRDRYAKGKTEINLNSALKFCWLCRGDYGFGSNSRFSNIDLESTFAGVSIAKLVGKEKELEINKIKGEVKKNNNWWNINLENQSCIADTQNLYRFSLLSQMTGHLNDELKEKISDILFECYDKT